MLYSLSLYSAPLSLPLALSLPLHLLLLITYYFYSDCSRCLTSL